MRATYTVSIPMDNKVKQGLMQVLKSQSGFSKIGRNNPNSHAFSPNSELLAQITMLPAQIILLPAQIRLLPAQITW